MDPWQEMEDWCAKRSATLCKFAAEFLEANGYDTDDGAYRTILGQSQAFARMRSFIHGARQQRTRQIHERTKL